MSRYPRLSHLCPLLVSVILPLALAGCLFSSRERIPTPGGNPDSAITVTKEQNGRFLAFVGPKLSHAEPFLGVPGTNIFALRSWLDTRTGEVASQLYVQESYYGNKRNWSMARDGAGQTLRLIAIGIDEITCENRCAYAEEFAASLPDALLRASAKGLTVTFSAQDGAQKTITVPGEQIVNQLAAVDAARAGTVAPTAQK